MQPFSWNIRVYYEDTDSGGVVYHANYLKFYERARTEMLRSIGFEQDQLKCEQDLLFVVRSLQIEYDKPALFNDLLTVETAIDKVGRASLVFAQKIYNPTNNIVSRARVKVACLKASQMSPMAIPSSIREAFAKTN